MDSQNRRDYINNTKRGSKRKRTESKLEVPVDLRVGLRTYFIALMLEEKLFIMRDQSLCLFFRADNGKNEGKSVIEMFWEEYFMVRNTVKKWTILIFDYYLY